VKESPQSSVTKVMWIVSSLGLASLLFLFAPRGLGLSPDSVAYLKSVQGIQQGQGLAYFSIQWPPLYSLVIAGISYFTANDFYLGSRALNAILYGAYFLCLGALLQRLTTRFRFLVYIFCILLALHPVIMRIYFYAFSEALFLPLTLLNFVLLAVLLNGKSLGLGSLTLALASVAFLATLTRYAGLCIVALNALIFLLSRAYTNPLKKSIAVLLQIIPSALFLFVWRQRMGIGDTDTNFRPFVIHLITLENIDQGFITIGQWLMPFVRLNERSVLTPLCWMLGVISIASIIALTYIATLRFFSRFKQRGEISLPTALSFLIGNFTIGYLIFLLLIRSFFDPNIVLDNRTLSPIFAPIFALFFVAISNIKGIAFRSLCITLIGCLFVFHLQTIRPLLLISYFNGIELADKNRLNSEIVRFVRTCPKDTTVYADRPWNFNLEFNSMVHWLPTKGLYGSWLPNLNYDKQVSALRNQAEVIIIEDPESEMTRDVTDLNTFRPIYSSNLGTVWLNNQIEKNICRERLVN
jgi:hypothetical protein